jgi:phage baseplate assembly protein W
MAFVYENIAQVVDSVNEIGLGVKFTNAESIFKTIYTVREQAKENLKTLLFTRIGERYMQPTFGTNLLNLLFEPNTIQIKEDVSEILIDPINVWLPYISIENINVITAEEDPTLPHQLSITITYNIENFSTDSIVVYANNDNTISIV